MDQYKEGKSAYSLVKKLYPIYRSITGDGVRESLKIIRDYIDASEFITYEVKTGTKAFDWIVPKEWKIRDAYIESETGERYAQFRENNLHVIGYSLPVDKWVDREELEYCIYTQKDQENAIPYVTSYYKERYGFCMSEKEKRSLTGGRYRVFVDSELFNGSLTYADCVFKGKSEAEIVISTYCCHPQMANDNCSGMALLAELAKYVKSLKNRYFTYRFAIFPETIGAIVYLSQNNRLEYMKRHTIGGYTLSCVGDDGDYSIILSKDGNSISDRALKNVLLFSESTKKLYKEYSYLERGSDERQYNSPGVGIPVTGFCRTKYWEFQEYHTSLDMMSFISPKGLQGSIDVMKEVIDAIEHNRKYMITTPCEPQLGRRGLYPTLSQKGRYDEVKAMMDFIGYADGNKDLIEISYDIKQPVKILIPIVQKLMENGLLCMGD